MPRPTRDEMLRMAKESRPREATVRPIAPVVEEKSSVRLRVPPGVRETAVTAPQPQPQQKQQIKVELGFDLHETMTKISNELRGNVPGYVLSFLAGTAVGLFVFGWWLIPVKPVDVSFDVLANGNKYAIVHTAADLAAYDPNSPKVLRLSNQWPELDDEACLLSAVEPDPATKMRLQSLAYRLNGVGCPLPTN